MTENTEEVEGEESDIEIDLDAPDQLAYEELVENFSEELIDQDIREVVKQHVRSLYDNQDAIRQRIAQAQQRQ